MFRSTLALIAVALVAAPASAQALGTFSWQLQPYCNVVTVNVTGVAGVYTLEGFDDQCGSGTRAPLTGVATPNPDGTIGFGMNLVTSPGGRGVQVEARIALANLSGAWSDSDGNTGTFAFNQTAGGSPRPVPVNGPVIPPVFGLQPDGGFVAGGAAGTGAIPDTGPGTRMMWHPKKSALRAGSVSGREWDDDQVGAGSVALGLNTVATGTAAFAQGQSVLATAPQAVAFGKFSVAGGVASLAAGRQTAATGDDSVAFGRLTKAAGPSAFAAGDESEALGAASVAIGFRAGATGASSTAFGLDARATGAASLAIGQNVRASESTAVAIGQNVFANAIGAVGLGSNASTSSAASGAFVFGDRSTANSITAITPNEFVVRASGGTWFYSNPTLTSGVRLAPGASAWSALSDANSKENFRDLDHGDLLATLAAMPIREWNYKAQDASIRHVGPTAQDFHAAFGLGEDPLRISTIDADGIALAGVSVLARENAALKAQIAALVARLDQLELLKR